jgi:hypothetical protein
MFVETYRRENTESAIPGGEVKPIPYPKISEEDWRVWTLFLPVRANEFDKKAASTLNVGSLHLLYGIPHQVATEIQRGSEYFDKVEVWRKRVVEKDPIAVGYQGKDRYMIARWGMEKLLPFETVKKSMPLMLAWKYGTDYVGIFAGLTGLGFVVWNFLL